MDFDHTIRNGRISTDRETFFADIGVKDGRIVGVRGRAVDSVNHGRLGPKGLHGWVANNSPDRLTTPLIRRNGKLEKATWDEAMSLIVQKSKELIAKHTSSSITKKNACLTICIVYD